MPESLDPHIAQLIKDMWQGDFRQRPAMNKVVERLEVCTLLQEDSSTVQLRTAVEEQVPVDDAPADSAKVIKELRAEIARLHRAFKSNTVDTERYEELSAPNPESHTEVFRGEAHDDEHDEEHTPAIGETHRYTERYEELN